VLEGGEPTVIANAEGSRTTPSVVGFAKTGDVVVGEVAKRQSAGVLRRLAGLGIDMEDAGSVLEEQEIAAFEQSFRGGRASLAGRSGLRRPA